MGNCLRHDSKVHWGGEDWTPALMTDNEKSAMNKEDEKKDEYSASSKVREVKVKITKKQLEELLGKMNMNNVQQQQQGFSAEQVLGQLVKVSVYSETHNRSWTPRLKSIPEV